jgi:arylformamidase
MKTAQMIRDLSIGQRDSQKGTGMKHVLAFAAGVSALAGCGAAAADRLPRECRREIVQKCGLSGGREGLIACIKQKSQAGAFSADCTLSLVKMAERRHATTTMPSGGRELRYGSAAKQALDFYAAPDPEKRPPLIVFIHGGGWAIGDKKSGTGDKASHFTGIGYAFASLDYRLVPEADPEGQAKDIASAIAFLRVRAPELGFDADRIILSGHSAGAHLAALVSSDERYLKAAGVPLSAIRGTVLLDGAGYDVATQMASHGGPLLAKLYTDAFGTDPANQKRLSPITYAGNPNVRHWLLIHDAKRADATGQSQTFAAALQAAGDETRLVPIPDSSHLQINHDLGAGDNLVTREVDAFVKAVL